MNWRKLRGWNSFSVKMQCLWKKNPTVPFKWSYHGRAEATQRAQKSMDRCLEIHPSLLLSPGSHLSFKTWFFPFMKDRFSHILYPDLQNSLSTFFSSFLSSFPSRSTPFCLPMDNGILLAYFCIIMQWFVCHSISNFLLICALILKFSLSLIYSSE